MNFGPTFADPLARQLYAEIASIEEQHVTQYESIIDPSETWLEKWVLHEANEVYNYYGDSKKMQQPLLNSASDIQLLELQRATLRGEMLASEVRHYHASLRVDITAA